MVLLPSDEGLPVESLVSGLVGTGTVPVAALPMTVVTTVDDGVEIAAPEVVGRVAEELVVDGDVKEELVEELVTICEENVGVEDEGVVCGAVVGKDDVVEVVVMVEETIVEEILVTVDTPPMEVDGGGGTPPPNFRLLLLV